MKYAHTRAGQQFDVKNKKKKKNDAILNLI